MPIAERLEERNRELNTSRAVLYLPFFSSASISESVLFNIDSGLSYSNDISYEEYGYRPKGHLKKEIFLIVRKNWDAGNYRLTLEEENFGNNFQVWIVGSRNDVSSDAKISLLTDVSPLVQYKDLHWKEIAISNILSFVGTTISLRRNTSVFLETSAGGILGFGKIFPVAINTFKIIINVRKIEGSANSFIYVRIIPDFNEKWNTTNFLHTGMLTGLREGKVGLYLENINLYDFYIARL